MMVVKCLVQLVIDNWPFRNAKKCDRRSEEREAATEALTEGIPNFLSSKVICENYICQKNVILTLIDLFSLTVEVRSMLMERYERAVKELSNAFFRGFR